MYMFLLIFVRYIFHLGNFLPVYLNFYIGVAYLWHRNTAALTFIFCRSSCFRTLKLFPCSAVTSWTYLIMHVVRDFDLQGLKIIQWLRGAFKLLDKLYLEHARSKCKYRLLGTLSKTSQLLSGIWLVLKHISNLMFS